MTEHDSRSATAAGEATPPAPRPGAADGSAGLLPPGPDVPPAPHDSAGPLPAGPSVAPAANGSADPPAANGSADPPAATTLATQEILVAPNGEVGIGTAAADHDGHGEKVRQWREKSRKRSKPKRPFWIELPLLIVIAFGLTFLIQSFIAKVYYVPSGSMETTLHGATSGGDRILVSKIVYDFRDPRRGDVVVFNGPDNWRKAEVVVTPPSSWFGKFMQSLGSVIGIAPPSEKDYVKRVIAVGGETVACCDAVGNVTINGQPLHEDGYIYEPLEFLPGLKDCTTSLLSQRCFAQVTVPPGQLWVMGDHRSDSADSSYFCQGVKAGPDVQCQGPVPVDNVIGKAIFIVMPPSRWGTIGNPDPGPFQAGGNTAALPVSGGVGLTLLLRGGFALLPGQRRRRTARRVARRSSERTRP